MKPINLYLDDLRDIPEGFVGARTFEEAVEYLKTGQVGLLSLDHDLGCDENGNELKTGYDLVLWICNEGIDIPIVYIHTDNPVGREKMYETLKGAVRREIISIDKLYHYGAVPNKYSDNFIAGGDTNV